MNTRGSVRALGAPALLDSSGELLARHRLRQSREDVMRDGAAALFLVDEQPLFFAASVLVGLGRLWRVGPRAPRPGRRGSKSPSVIVDDGNRRAHRERRREGGRRARKSIPSSPSLLSSLFANRFLSHPSARAPLEAGMSRVKKNGITMAAAANARAAASRDERENDLHRVKP
jgi:hypothetical protein